MSEYIRTFSGDPFYPLDAEPSDIRIEDIAHTLSRLCRWNGHLPGFYSVGLHSIHVSFMVEPEHARAALLHDASEGLGLSDIAKPVKLDMPEYQIIEHRLMKTIADALNFEFPFHEQVKQADAAALFLEHQYFFPDHPGDVPHVNPPIKWYWDFSKMADYRRFDFDSVEHTFLSRYHQLTNA